MHLLLPWLSKRPNLVIVHQSSFAALAARHSRQLNSIRTGESPRAESTSTHNHLKRITERPASDAVDCENATIRQHRHAKSKQIAINAIDDRHVVAATSPAAAALQRHEVEAEPELLSRRGHEKSIRLQGLQVQHGAVVESRQ